MGLPFTRCLLHVLRHREGVEEGRVQRDRVVAYLIDRVCLRDVYGFLEPLAGAGLYVGLRRWIAALDEPAVIRDELAGASHQETIDRGLRLQRRAPGDRLIAVAV